MIYEMLQMTYAYSSNGKCLLSFVVFFPYTVKLTFVLDASIPPLFILLPKK